MNKHAFPIVGIKRILKSIPVVRVLATILVRGWRRLLQHLIIAWRRLTWPLYYKSIRQRPEFQERSIALMTVFILQENILFMEEWLDHHVKMGVDHFFLYDNSKVQKRNPAPYEKRVVPGKVNKHGRSFDTLISAAEAQERLSHLLKQYHGTVTVVPWERKGDDGLIGMYQNEAIQDFVHKNSHIYDYALHIDIDEFMVSRKGYTLKQIRSFMERDRITSYYFTPRYFSSRFNYIGQPVLSISKCLPYDRESVDCGYKTLFKMSTVVRIHLHCTRTLFKAEVCPTDEMMMYHYCYNSEANLIDDAEALTYI